MITDIDFENEGFLLEKKQATEKFSKYKNGNFYILYSKKFRYRKDAVCIYKKLDEGSKRLLFDGVVKSAIDLRVLLSMMGAGYNLK